MSLSAGGVYGTVVCMYTAFSRACCPLSGVGSLYCRVEEREGERERGRKGAAAGGGLPLLEGLAACCEALPGGCAGGMMRGGLALGCGVMMLAGVALGEQGTVRHFGSFSPVGLLLWCRPGWGLLL